MKDKKGIALILSVGILALLAGIATSFALNMRLEYKAAINYHNGVKARYRAEAAIERAIYELKTHVQASAFDDLTEVWAATAYQNDIDGDGANDATSNILDEQRKVNINTGNQQLLENLFAELGIADPAALYTAINGNRPYRHLQELISIAGITAGEYNTIIPYVSISAYVDPSTARSPININTCSEDVLRAVLTGLSDGATTVSAATVTNVVAAIQGARPIEKWSDPILLDGFDDVVDVSAPVSEAAIIKDNCNPNRVKPAVAYTTEFCFNSGGYYEISGTGDVLIGGIPIAQKAAGTVVKIYDIYNETTKAQFELGAPVRVTWLDSCPINAAGLFGSSSIPADAETVPGSLKIGYWDNFDEDAAYTTNEWTGPYAIGDPDGDGDNELYSPSQSWPSFRLADAGKWTWGNNTLRISEEDSVTNQMQIKESGWVQCNGQSILLGKTGFLEWGPSGYWYRNMNGECVYNNQNRWPKWEFSSALIRFPNTVYSDGSMSYSVLRPYNAQKTFNMTNSSAGAGATVYDASGTASITYPIGGASTLNLYGQNQKPYWDDLRIISSDGNYTSLTNTPVGAGDSVNWGTIVFTGTAQANTAIVVYVNTGSGFGSPITSGASIGTTTDSIQYKVNFTSASTMQNTPIFEDITITYLHSTKIFSWSE